MRVEHEPEQVAAAPTRGGQEHEPASAPGRGADSELEGVLFKMQVLEPGDHKLLAKILGQHPQWRDAIVAKAQEFCGNDTVAKALELLERAQALAADAETTETATTTTSATKTVDTIADTKQGPAQPKQFVYILSPLALEYDRDEKIRDHVEYIRKHPELRDQVLVGAAEFDAKLASDVAAALAREPSSTGPATPTPTSDEGPEGTPAATADGPPFEYILSFLALEYDREQKVKDHVDFIQQNPDLRDAVLIGAAEFDVDLAEQVRQRLAKPEPTPATASKEESTPPDVVLKDAEESTPAAAPETSTAKPKSKGAEDTATKDGKPEAGWVVRARAYNAAHWDTVNVFNDLTRFVCVDAEGNLDPNLVATWQAEHGTPPDGRVGEGTVAAAIIDSPFEDEMAPALAPEAPPPAADPS